jgi:arsenate reductase-like glutaredoxin family protein
MRTREVLEQTRTEVTEERSSRKQPLSDSEVRTLLRSVDEVIVARGRKAVRMPAKDARLDDLRGRSGSFRAPIVRRGRSLLVGFHADSLSALLGA